jgi:hypothetical protein
MLPTNEELAVEKEFKEEIEGVLARIRPSLGGASKRCNTIYAGARYRKCA